MFREYVRICLFLLAFFTNSSCYDPLTVTYGVVGISASVFYAGYEYLNCYNNECCDDSWIPSDMDRLERSLHEELFGQHLVTFIVPKSLKGHIRSKNPKKALAFSFNGWTGCGKNYASALIAKSLYKNGLKSQYVHLYIGPKDFPHKEEVNKYRDQLRREIPAFTKKCGRSLFIFDEVDKMPPGLLDALTPFLDYHEAVDGVDYRKNIFIFLSNAGGKSINQITLKFWSDGMEREQITLRDVESFISKGAFNERGGFQHSEIVKKDLISSYIPFLPLEKKHIKKCIFSEMKTRGLAYDQDTIDAVANELLYYPSENEIYSVSGCKKVSEKIDVFV